MLSAGVGLIGKGAERVQLAVMELTWYLDIFYTDVEGWVELADMYVKLNLCVQAFSVCVVLMPGQVHALAAGPRAHAAAHSTEPVPHAVLHGDGIHGRGHAPCAQDVPLSD